MKKLTDEIINKIKNIDTILLNRKKSDFLAQYNSGSVIHKKQIEFHKCCKRNRWVFGGNRTGKTECGAVEVVWLARGNHPFKKVEKSTSGWVVSLSSQVQRDVAQNKILHYLKREWIREIVMQTGKKSSPESGIIDHILIENVFGNISRIGFKSCDQGREKFQGTSLDYVWFDEEPPKEIYEECRMRVLDTRGNIFGTMTPLKGLTWVYDEIYLNKYKNEEVWHENISWEDNPYLSKNEIKLLESTMSTSELESRKFGKFTFSAGAVYPEFDENTHVITPFNVPADWQDTISIDPGLNNPLSAHWYAVDYDGNVYVVAEHFEAGRDVAYHAQKIKEISARLNWRKNAGGMIDALIDSAANQTTLSSIKSVSSLFFENGIAVNPKVNKDLFTGINKVKSYLKNANGNSKLFIFKNCINLIRELKSYWWGDGERPIKTDDHSLDELRYYLMSKPETPKKQEEKSPLLKEKEKLARKLFLQNRL